MRSTALVLVLLLATPAAALPFLPTDEGTSTIALASPRGPLGLPIEPEDMLNNATNETSEVLGQNLTREDVRLRLDVDFRKLDLDLVGVMFGGGTFEAQARIALNLDIRSLDLNRIRPILEERAGQNVTLPLERSQAYLAADEMRTALAGEALRAFQDEQEAATRNLIESAFPDLTVLTTRFEWSNVSPAVNARGEDARVGMPPLLTEPPITLDATIEMQFLKSESLVSIIDQARARKAALERDPSLENAKEQKKAQIDRLRAENQGPLFDRSAFSLMGITQLLVLEMDPGWDLDVMMSLPPGYTFEYASADVAVDEGFSTARAATYARLAGSPVENPVAVSLSSRYLVTATMLATVLLLGALLRVPTLLIAHRVVAASARRRLERREAARARVLLGGRPADVPHEE